ncbi:MAG: carbohydrate ABC transporter permease [Clostridiales bacterium]|nr:carbohydrate ABC transporter permease [Clostridiales bacterium]
MSVVIEKPKKKNHIRSGSLVADVLIYALLAFLSIIFIYPLYQVIVNSISDPAVVATRNGLLLWPTGIQFDAYRVVFRNKNLWTGFKNTLVYMALGTSLQYFVTLITAYALSLKDLRFKKGLMIYFTVTMYFGGGIIPYFLLITRLGLMNSMWVLIIPQACNVWNIILMRTQFVNLPGELKEAATIDGAGDVTMLFRIMLPLSGAVSAVLILFTAVGYWNMWFDPMIYLTKRSMYPLQSVMREILIDNAAVAKAGAAGSNVKINRDVNQAAVNALIKYANIVVSTVPILCVYPFAQKYFVKGALVGSLKG